MKTSYLKLYIGLAGQLWSNIGPEAWNKPFPSVYILQFYDNGRKRHPWFDSPLLYFSFTISLSPSPFPSPSPSLLVSGSEGREETSSRKDKWDATKDWHFAFFMLCLYLPVEGSVALSIGSSHKSSGRADYLKHFCCYSIIIPCKTK